MTILSTQLLLVGAEVLREQSKNTNSIYLVSYLDNCQLKSF